MVPSQQYRYKVTIWVATLFLILAFYRWWNGMLLYQIMPSFFVTRMDAFTWVFMYTGLHKWLLNNPTLWIVFDMLFCTLPLVYLLAYVSRFPYVRSIAWVWFVMNWVYIQCYTL